MTQCPTLNQNPTLDRRPSRRREAAVRRAAGVAIGVAVVCGAWACPAQVPSATREELMRQWDLDRDGRVTESEAEIARGRMRRARMEALTAPARDPLAGRRPSPLAPSSSAAGDARDTPSDDDGLILVPGTGAGPLPPRTEAADRGRPRATPSDRPTPPATTSAIPGTRAPALAPAVPAVTPRLPGSSMAEARGDGAASPAGRPPLGPMRPPGTGMPSAGSTGRPGVISGGARAGATAARPGYGGGVAPPDLNAGRLPAGFPQTRGSVAGTAGGFRGPPLPGQAAPSQPTAPAAARGGMAPRAAIGARGTGAVPTTQPVPPRPGVRPPQPPSSSASPRVPRINGENVSGR